MERKAVNEEQFFRYLLGELPEEEMDKLEENYFLDDDLFGELQAAERELIDRYVEGSLSKDEQDRFEHFFLLTPARQEKLRFARALKRYTPDQTPLQRRYFFVKISDTFLKTRRFVASPVGIAVSIILILCIGLGVWRIFFHPSVQSRVVAALSNAYREQRYVEPRISGVEYSSLSEVRGEDQTYIDRKERNRAELLALNEVNDNPSPSSYHTLGQVYLAELRLDEAVTELEKASQMDPSNARIHSDLGAALFEKWKKESDAEELARSLEHLKAALELNPSLPEALFNLALVFQNMKLYAQAQDQWQNYLEKDPSSQWADEARHNLDQINEQIKINEQRKQVSYNDQQLLLDFLDAYEARDDAKAWDAFCQSRDTRGSCIVNQLLDSFLDSSLKGIERDDTLRALSYAGQIELSKASDHFTLDLARFYSLTTKHQRLILAQARELLKSAHALFSESNEFDKSEETYRKSKSLFKQAGSASETSFIEYRLSHCYLRQSKPMKTLPKLLLLSEAYDRPGYRWLLAQTFFSLADACINLNRFSEAIKHSTRSLQISNDVQDRKSVVRALIQLAEEHRLIGDYRKSLGFLQRALSLADDVSMGRRDIWGIYFVTALNYNHLKLHQAALEFNRAALRLAEEVGSPLYISRSYAHIALVYGELKQYADAIKNAEQAYEIGRKISKESIGLNMMAYSSLQIGHLYRQAGNFGKALSKYNEVLDLYNRLDFGPHRYQAHKGRFQTFVALGDDLSAKGEIEIALKLFETYRTKIEEESNNNIFFGKENDIYDLAIDFEYSRMNDPEKAFNYMESGRSRSLLAMIHNGVQIINKEGQPNLQLPPYTEPYGIAELKGRLPDGVQILQYAVLSDKVLIFVVSKAKLLSREVSIESSALKEKVIKYLEGIKRPNQSQREERLSQAMELYDILIRPIEPCLDTKNIICVVPDKFLNYLCYDALVSPATGRFLIEDYSLSFSTSSNMFVSCSEIALEKKMTRNEKAFIVGNPKFDSKVFPSLMNLPASEREAEQIAQYYNSPVVLMRRDATENRIKSEMERADVIHLAMHYEVDKQSPLLSNFVLAKESGAENSPSDGAMQTYEIYGLKLANARLIVLSACKTGIENYFDAEGAIGAMRPFIADRVPLVVCSLWPVESESAAELMTAFHKYRKLEGRPTVEALRRAKVEMLNGTEERFRSPYYWASFIAVGGYADY